MNHKINDNSDDKNNKSTTYRGPGNDMNSTKYKELLQYVQAGYPVVIADAFLNDAKDAATTKTMYLQRVSYWRRHLILRNVNADSVII